MKYLTLESKNDRLNLVDNGHAVQPSLENLANIFKNLGEYRKLLDKFLKILETRSELIHMFTCYKLLLIVGLIPICNLISGE